MHGSHTTTPSILVAGSINADLVLRTNHLPAPGESLLGGSYYRIAGGKGANQAVAAARLGAAVTFVGKTGSDPEGQSLRAQLSAEGVRTEFLRHTATQTGLAVITVDDSGQNSIIVIPGANREVNIEDVSRALRGRSYDALMLQLEIDPQAVIATCRMAAAQGVPVVLDAGPAQEFPLEELQGIAILTPNETETCRLSGVELTNLHEAKRAAEVLLRRSRAHAVVLKLGERGALLCRGGEICEHFPAFAIRAVDATAAGDAFTAALTLAYIRTKDLRRAVIEGNAAGALAAMTFGAQPSLPTALALQQFCAERFADAG